MNIYLGYLHLDRIWCFSSLGWGEIRNVLECNSPAIIKSYNVKVAINVSVIVKGRHC
jgi:hypothetical protein